MLVRLRLSKKKAYLKYNNIMEFSEIISHFDKTLSSIQAGRVTPSILEDIQVEAYGSRQPLQQLASVTNQGPQCLHIQPWDPTVTKDIERALRTSGHDFNPVVEGTSLRLPFPPLTEEKRITLTKLVEEHGEEAHVAIKRQREDQMQALKQQKTDKAISEDQFFAESKKLQKQVDDYNAQVEQRVKDKSAQLMKL